MTRSDDAPVHFPREFLFGSATSSYQVEGAWDADGKGESIWDRFAHTTGRIRGGDSGDIACDHYHRLAEDVSILRRLHQKSYRFSVSWPRIQPQGMGPVNRKGIDHYSRLVDALLEAGIRPLCTLYHWDLPQALEEIGGWPNRSLAGYFADYAGLVAEHLGDRISVWALFNMPWTFTYFGYGIGMHPPGRSDPRLFLQAAHTVNLAQGEAFRAIKAASPGASVGSAYGMAPAYPKSESNADRRAAAAYHATRNDYFLKTAMQGCYPKPPTGRIFYEEMGFKPGDEELMRAPLDWIGFHYYTRRIVSAAAGAPESRQSRFGTETERETSKDWEEEAGFSAYMPTEGQLTHAGLEVWPRGIYDLVMQVTREYDGPPIEITECGCSYLDDRQNREVHDDRRTQFFRAHLAELARAIADGADVRAFHAWSLLDNFEWTEGYSQRYGLTHVDFASGKRTVKDSGLWYAMVSETNSLET